MTTTTPATTIDSGKLLKWKVHGTPTPVRVSTEAGKTADGEVYIQSWDKTQRTRRATKWLLMIWGVGTFCILFPIIHFVLPPLLLISGPIIAFQLAQQSSAVLGGIGKCPNCGHEFEIVRGNYLKPTDQWPLTDICSNCRADVSIERVDAHSSA
jgi:hypothetical protein